MTDLFLKFPFPDTIGRLVLFSTFLAHFVFVLLTLGTGLAAALLLIRRTLHPEMGNPRWDRRVLHGFLPLKALAVVLGVGPLLTIQVFHTQSFFAGIHAFAPHWLLLIAIMILAFLLLELVAEGMSGGLAEVSGIVLLAAIPAVFVAVVLAAENSVRPAIWAARYLHVLGAAAVAGSLVYYFRLRDQDASAAAFLLRAAVAALGIQAALGLVLFLLLPLSGTLQARIVLLTGAGAGFLLMAYAVIARRRLDPAAAAALLTLAIVPMLVFRQHVQDSSIAPVKHHEQPRPYRAEALAAYRSDLTPRWQSGAGIYASSCSFCHGENGDGRGPDSADLAIPAESIATIRTRGPALRSNILRGVPGTGMPYFSILTAGQAGMLTEYLNRRFGIESPPEAVTVPIEAQDRRVAGEIYSNACAVCHGRSGVPTAYGQALQPPPPNLAVYTFAPSRVFEVVTNGYPGTEMRSFASLDAPVRWGLVRTVTRLYRAQ